MSPSGLVRRRQLHVGRHAVPARTTRTVDQVWVQRGAATRSKNLTAELAMMQHAEYGVSDTGADNTDVGRWRLWMGRDFVPPPLSFALQP